LLNALYVYIKLPMEDKERRDKTLLLSAVLCARLDEWGIYPWPEPTMDETVDAGLRIQALVNALMACRMVRELSSRSAIVSDLDRQIADTIALSNTPRVDVESIVKRCDDFDAVPALVDSVARHEGESKAMKQVRIVLKQHWS